MPRSLGYKNKGDRVIVINQHGYGLHGMISANDGFGEVVVELDNGLRFHGYEERDLVYENEYEDLELPPKVFVAGSVAGEIWHEIGPDGSRWKTTDLLGGFLY